MRVNSESEITFAYADSLGEGLNSRIHIDSEDHLIKYGFLPGTNVLISWKDDEFSCLHTETHTLHSVWEPAALSIHLPSNLQIEDTVKFELKWSPGKIIGSPTTDELNLQIIENEIPLDSDEGEEEIENLAEVGSENHLEFAPDSDFIIDLRAAIEKLDHSRSSNTKYKNPPPGLHYSVRQLIAEFLDLDEDEVYIVGVTTRIHNLRKNLLQSTQNDHHVGVGLFLGGDWNWSTLIRYCNDEKISGNFKEGVLFFCYDLGELQFVGAGLQRLIYADKLKELYEPSHVIIHQSPNSLKGKIGELAEILQGQTIRTSRSEYHCSVVNEFSVIFKETERTGKLMLPTDLVIEWIVALEEGEINIEMSARECRDIVTKFSKWANLLHAFETHLKAIIIHWHLNKRK